MKIIAHYYENGACRGCEYVDDGYSLNVNEEFIDVDKIPETSTLHKQEYIDYLASIEYQELRRNEYPPLQDQLDYIFHNGLDAWKVTIQAIKDKYPKP